MIAALRSEWVKLRTITSSVVLMLSIAGASIGLAVLIALTIPTDSDEVELADRLSLALAGVNVSLTLLAVLGVLTITQEFRFGTIRVTFAAVPRRARVILAKAGVLAIVALVVSAVMVALSVLIGGAILSGRGIPIDFDLPGTNRVLLGTLILAILHVVIGLAVGTIVRSQPLALVIVVLWPALVEGIVGNIFTEVGKWLPFRAGSALVMVDPGKDFPEPWAGAGYFAAVTLLLLVAAIVVVRRRDA